MHTRFKGDSTDSFQELKAAADSYPRTLTEDEQLGFWQKPLDWNPGHPNFFNNMFQILNGIRAMGLAPEATIVEVGSGTGWTTEILAGLRYNVICLEPAEVMLETARKRVADFLALRRMSQLAENVSYHCSTLEEADFVADQSADAMVFFESFHHIIDEHKALDQAFRILKPGGVLCILGDSNWIPGHAEQERFWMEEMARFGTLESPFTHEYLTEVLGQHGFRDVRRHHSVNGLIAVEDAARPAAEFAGHLNAAYVNLFTARRPASGDEAREGSATVLPYSKQAELGVSTAPDRRSRLRRWASGVKAALLNW